MSARLTSLFAAVVLLSGSVGSQADAAEPADDPLDLFNQRIMPIFRSDKPSSCVQCHLSSVDLKEYILPSHEQTFVSLRDQGLIDLDSPAESKILQLIQMGEKDLDEGARLIHEKTRQAEFAAFAAWVTACCEDPQLRGLPPLDSSLQARPASSDPVIRHARKSRVVDSFVRNVWSQRMRCFPCHTPYELDEADARHQPAIKKQQEFKKQYPELVDRLKIFHRTPEETVQYLITESRQAKPGELPLLNLENPRESLLVLKPTSKLPAKNEAGKFDPPSSAVPVSHMGGLKMHANDQSYKSFVSWIQDYANVVNGQYTSVEDLPADNWLGTNLVVRLTDAPADWPVGTTVQLFVHSWDAATDSWSEQAAAFTQGTVTPRHMVNGAVSLLQPKPSTKHSVAAEESPTLARGKYLVKVYVDADNRLDEDPSLLLGPEEFAGQAEIGKARWREGFRFAETVSGKEFSQQ